MKQVTIETGARLHFGLLDTESPFGGIGAMIDSPPTTITLKQSEHFEASPAIEKRATEVAHRFANFIGSTELPKASVSATQLSPSHCGFGSGTQQSMAIAEGLCRLHEISATPETIARTIADRGKRSVVGIHGYFHGGFLFEAAGEDAGVLNAIQEQSPLCPNWRVALIRPQNQSATFGDDEKHCFERLDRPSAESRAELRRLIEEEIVPAVQNDDFSRFANSLERYNRASGMMYAAIQGGPYNGQRVQEMIQKLKSLSVPSVGQSSWGPCVFAWIENDADARKLAYGLSELDGWLCQIAKPLNQGRKVEPNLE